MATILSQNNISSSDFETQMTADLKTLFDFVDEDDGKLYITDDLYIKPGVNMQIGNAHTYFTINMGSSSGNYYRLVKSASGDVAILANTSELVDNTGFRLAIVKVKNALTNEESYGIFANSTSGGTSSSDAYNYGKMLLFTDDVEDSAALTQVATDPTSLGSTAYFAYGAKTNAPIAVLGEVFSHQSQCITQNTKVMYVTPRPYNGKCTINGKSYYCITYIAMLDE